MKREAPALAEASPITYARRILFAFVLLSSALPLYLLLKQSVTPELETFAWPPYWLPHHLTFSHFASVFEIAELKSAVVRSLAVATLSSALATILGAMLANSMARSSSTQRLGLWVISGVRLMPMIAIAIPLGILLGSLRLYDTPSGIGLAVVHAAIALPTTTLTAYAAFVAIPIEVEEAAWLDGASALRIFLTIDVPLCRGALAAAYVLGFIMSWDEFGFSLLLQQTNRTLPPLLYYYTVFGNVGPASALALLMMIPAICVVVALRPVLWSAMSTGSTR
jgi:ABC-type glycerol-3-phosphate transport system permease component